MIRAGSDHHSQLSFKYSLEIAQPREKIFKFLRNFENLPRIISEVAHVEPVNDSATIYRVDVHPFGLSANSFYLFIVKEHADSFLGWSSATDTLLYTTGKFELSPMPNSSAAILHLVFSFTPPLGKIGLFLTKLFYSSVRRRIERSLIQIEKSVEADNVVQFRN